MEKLTIDLLKQLKQSGYHVLESDRVLPDENAVLNPVKVEDWDNYLHSLNEDEVREYIIDDALGYPESELKGFVNMPE